jgi:Fe-S-cluster containining protein
MDAETQRKLEALYDALDAEIAAVGPRCEMSGRCCRFDEFGHTLFLSRLEAEYLLIEGLPAGQTVTPNRCPYQIDRRCTARQRRPIGCRVFFCDPSFAVKKPELSEAFIRRLKTLHVQTGSGWEYRSLGDWLAEFHDDAPQARASGGRDSA